MGEQESGAGMTSEEVQALFLYGDIIDLPAPEPRRHPRQPRGARAAQFAPFAALAGYGDEVREAARGTQERRELSADEQERIAAALAELKRRLDAAGRAGAPAEVEYYVPDARKEGGSYVRRAVVVERVDEAARRLVARPASSVLGREGGSSSACEGGFSPAREGWPGLACEELTDEGVSARDVPGAGPAPGEPTRGDMPGSSHGVPSARKGAGSAAIAPAAGGGRLLIPIDSVSDLILPGGPA